MATITNNAAPKSKKPKLTAEQQLSNRLQAIRDKVVLHLVKNGEPDAAVKFAHAVMDVTDILDGRLAGPNE